MYLIHFVPVVLFVLFFVGSGIYYTLNGVESAFYQLSPVTAILPAIALGWVLHRGHTSQKMHDFLDGVRHRDIITMCLIFLLAGAFSEVTKAIGSVEATAHFALSLTPSRFLLIGLFLGASFIATSIGTSMGTIATVAPIAAGLSVEAGIAPALAVATVVGGAMFGDNLSLISDTTIAAVASQEADMKQKLKVNVKVALIASFFTLLLLFFTAESTITLEPKPYSLILVAPYVVLVLLAVLGFNVFVALFLSITFAAAVGWWTQEHYTLAHFSAQLNKGFVSMNEIMILSLLVGGLSGLAGKHFTREAAGQLSDWISRRNAGVKGAQLMIANVVSVFDLLLANNTIAIIFSGEIARELARKHRIPPHYSAAWLDIFSCVVQGIIPYGAQVLLASTIAGVSPLSVVPYVYYCYILGVVTVAIILFTTPFKVSSTSH